MTILNAKFNHLPGQFDSIGPKSKPAELDAFMSALDARLHRSLQHVLSSEPWQTFMSPSTDPYLIRLILKEVYLEIFSYQPHVIEATVALVAQWPKWDAKTIKTLLRHQAEEADHGEMALHDYVALGGDEDFARNRAISPASFATAALWWGLWRMESPFAYLGALYPFEGLTPQVSQAVLQRITGLGIPENALSFLRFHATEDVKHASLVRFLIKDVAKRHAGAANAMIRGLEYFTHLYPLPVYAAAFERATAIYADEGAQTVPAPGRLAV